MKVRLEFDIKRIGECNECPCFNYEYDYCEAVDKPIREKFDCPLVPVHAKEDMGA